MGFENCKLTILLPFPPIPSPKLAKYFFQFFFGKVREKGISKKEFGVGALPKEKMSGPNLLKLISNLKILPSVKVFIPKN